jgi:hypothetical protein
MKFRSIGLAALLSQVSLLLISPSFAQVVWLGSTSSDAGDPTNWDTGTVPTSASAVHFRSGDNGTVNLWGDVTWNNIELNDGGATTINGAGTITLSTPSGNAFFSGGGPHSSVINPNISSSRAVQVNGAHSVTFNGDVNVAKIEGFGTTVSTYNGDVTVTDEFISGHARIVFNGNYHLNKPSGIAGMGINNSGSDITFTTLSSSDFLYPNGVDILNLYGGHTIRNGQDNTFIESKPWSRVGTNTYSLNGFSDELFFIGSEAAGTGNNPGPVPAVMAIDFGATPGANSLNWLTSLFMDGTYPVTNFEIGTDSLQLGAGGAEFFTDDLLAKVTINGIAYSATDPGNGNPYWNRDLDNFVQFFNVPDLAGDYNNNGIVDAADYTVWRDHLGAAITLPNDSTPGLVTNDDYVVWKSNFGSTNPGSGSIAGAAIPEPGSLVLCLLAAVPATAAAGMRTRRTS